MGPKRSCSDPASWYPNAASSGSLGTISENVLCPDYNIGGPRFDMPSIQTELETSRLYPHLYGSASGQSAVEHSLRAGPADPTLLGVI